MTKISFIVVAYNAAQSLDALLGDLLAQTVDPRQLEALLVDSASTDDTAQIMRRFAERAPFAAQCQNGTYEPMVWQCVYRRGFLTENHLRMAEGLLFEDELFQAPALLKAGRAAAFDDVILHYRQRAGSIMASFARNAKWCDSYVQVCARLHDAAQSLPDGAAKAALNKRVGQIALSVGKNIPAYHLTPEVAREATDFLKAHRRQLARYAMESGDAAVTVQGALLKLSPELFIKLYQGAKA